VDEPKTNAAGSLPLQLAVFAAILVGAAFSLTAIEHYRLDGYMTDDAFISFRYARNLADGVGPVWQSGSNVEGYTNFGWVLLMAGSIKLGFDPIDASRALGLASGLGTIALLPIAAAQLRPRSSGEWWIISVGGMLALAVNTGFALWAFAGLETPLFCFLLFAALTAHFYEERREVAQPWLSAVALLLAALTRPDGGLIWLIIAGWKLLGPSRLPLRSWLVWTGAFLLPFAVYWLWRWNYYGDFFPNTYYLKSGGGEEFYERGVRYLRDFVLVYSVWLALAALACALAERGRRHRPASCGLLLLLVWLAYVAYSGGDWMPYYRFLMPVLPVAYLLMLHGTVTLAQRLATRAPSAVKIAALVAPAVAIVLLSLFPIDQQRAKDPSVIGIQRERLPGAVHQTVHREVGLWMKENVPDDYTIALIATGIVPYYSERKTLDMLGVNDRHIARRDVPVGLGSAGHDKQDGGYVIASKPEIIWLALTLEEWPRTTAEHYLPPIDDRAAPVVTDVTQNPYVWYLYTPVAIRIGEAWLNLLVANEVNLPWAEERADAP
jgi:hypothetical protein